jgi:hypothetical protein
MPSECGRIDTIEITDLPLLVLADGPRSLFSFAIKVHQRGYYGHAMWLYRLDKEGEPICASQGWTFKEVPLSKYFKKSYIKLWRSRNWGADERYIVRRRIDSMMQRPWWKRRYDYLGILGQAVYLRWVNFPFRDYCSESAAKPLRDLVGDGFDVKHPSPTDINKWCKTQPDFYRWDFWTPPGA